ncbi:hypothetical protein BWQ96_10476 [Gracilariopsis chorda]|uniref:Uncharacterized protein n=1 Tax=Gracilariopsis chorda TaxID=448386 RepID=A0A2V3ICK1_9FLOR|nr:hypothetical protein BWQ96_10476 [Gracilariopsis chorda]|eukprot:PXF39814.1 hypothetical protein BWQ96_10476 [Gracilariopsis chorda]
MKIQAVNGFSDAICMDGENNLITDPLETFVIKLTESLECCIGE